MKEKHFYSMVGALKIQTDPNLCRWLTNVCLQEEFLCFECATGSVLTCADQSQTKAHIGAVGMKAVAETRRKLFIILPQFIQKRDLDPTNFSLLTAAPTGAIKRAWEGITYWKSAF